MDLNRVMELAGLLREFKEPEDNRDDRPQGRGNGKSSSGKAEVHFADKIMGQFGTTIIIDGIKEIGELAELLGIPKGWKLTKVGKVYAAFNEGDRLTFFTDKRDFEPDEE